MSEDKYEAEELRDQMMNAFDGAHWMDLHNAVTEAKVTVDFSHVTALTESRQSIGGMDRLCTFLYLLSGHTIAVRETIAEIWGQPGPS